MINQKKIKFQVYARTFKPFGSAAVRVNITKRLSTCNSLTHGNL